MKQSHYNFLVNDNDNIYCFNGLTRHFFSIKKKNKEILNTILNSPDVAQTKLPVFYKLLIDGGFIINNDTDELNIIRSKNEKACNSKKYNLTILPTLDCNFRCWYCYENHTPYKMSNDTVERIKKYIFNIVELEEIEHLNIEWFGGEPFLHFEDIIKPISEYAKKTCQNKNIPFDTGATSNGYLVNKNISAELAEINFSHIQVTLDGEKSMHDKTRVASNDSSFETILSNMNSLCKINSQIKILIRINYDDKNFYPELIFSQIKELIDEAFHYRFTFLLRKVWQINDVANGNEKALKFIQLIRNSKFKYHRNADLILNFRPCYAAQKSMRMITPYGSIGKCTTKDDFEMQAIGHLTDNGTIEWKNNIDFDEIYAVPLFENEQCLNCKQLPLCMGNCPKDIDTDGHINFSKECRGKVNDLKLVDTILNFCKTNGITQSSNQI